MEKRITEKEYYVAQAKLALLGLACLVYSHSITYLCSIYFLKNYNPSLGIYFLCLFIYVTQILLICFAPLIQEPLDRNREIVVRFKKEKSDRD